MTALSPEALLKTIYFGDRCCKAIQVDGWKDQVSVTIDTISRIRSKDGVWDYYTDEDIADGRLVFSGARSIRFTPPGPLPNDYVNGVSLERLDHGMLLFTLSINSVDRGRTPTEVVVTIEADGFHLEDPRRPGEALND